MALASSVPIYTLFRYEQKQEGLQTTLESVYLWRTKFISIQSFERIVRALVSITYLESEGRFCSTPPPGTKFHPHKYAENADPYRAIGTSKTLRKPS